MKSIRTLFVLFVAVAIPAVFIADPAVGQFYAGSRLLLNYFEVDLGNAEITTLFAITNTAPEPIEVRASIYSNWGIRILDSEFELDGHQVLTADLHNWLAAGNLPDRVLGVDELEHVQTSLSGRRSPMTDMFYSKELFLYQAVGYVVFQAIGGAAEPDSLMGDFFNLVPGQDYAQGQALLNVDPASPCDKICFRHGLRFLSGGFDAGTEIFVWTRRQGSPSTDGYFPNDDRVQAEVLVYEESGQLIDTLALELLPLELIKVGDLGLPAAFGWFDITTEEESFIAVRYGALGRFSVGLKTFCLPLVEDPGPGIRLQKRTNGVDADFAPGPEIAVGDPVTWTYVVTNTGGVALSDVDVSDSEGVEVSCPADALEPGASMTCTGHGVAEPCQYENLGIAAGTAPDGTVVDDDDPSHYYGLAEVDASIDVEKHTNGFDADSPEDNDLPILPIGGAVLWEYIVTNTGSVPLNDIVIVDDLEGVVTEGSEPGEACPTSLAAGDTMTCTSMGIADRGNGQVYANVGTVNAHGAGICGSAQVTDSDPSHYKGGPGSDSCEMNPAVDLEKSTNGFDADEGLGPELEIGQLVTWKYQVTNIGDVALFDVEVEDDIEGAVNCDQSTLEPGESMECFLYGAAVEGEYANLGSVEASAGAGPQCDPEQVADSDPSHYHTPPPNGGGEGCTPGYWKQPHHFDSWQGFEPGDLFSDVFGVGPAVTLLDAVSEGGGGYDALGRHAVAGLLNSSHSGVDYLFDLSTVIGLVQGAYADGDPESTKDDLAEQNEQGCPLN